MDRAPRYRAIVASALRPFIHGQRNAKGTAGAIRAQFAVRCAPASRPPLFQDAPQGGLELPHKRRRTPLLRATVWTAVATGAFEAVYITWQGAVGQPSHFNTSTPFHTAMFILMGMAALLFTATSLPVAHQLWRHADGMAPAYRLGAVLGLLLTFAAGAGGGVAISAHGGPLVGAAAGPGLPLTGWSVTGGDLRVAHFLGVHAQQVLPLVGYLLGVAGGRHASAAVALATAAYLGLVGLALARAYAGLPLFEF